LANCREHVAKTNTSRPHPPTPSALSMAPSAREVKVEKLHRFPVRDLRARATGIFCFPFQTATWSSLYFTAPPRPFYPACSSPQGCFFARDLTHEGGPVHSPDGYQVLESSVRQARHASTAATTTRSSAATTCFTTGPWAVSMCPARCSLTSSPS
jgi:hypothetical protein